MFQQAIAKVLPYTIHHFVEMLVMMWLFYTFSLQFFKDVPNCRILVCGGDGTVGWLLEAMGKLHCVIMCID